METGARSWLDRLHASGPAAATLPSVSVDGGTRGRVGSSCGASLMGCTLLGAAVSILGSVTSNSAKKNLRIWFLAQTSCSSVTATLVEKRSSTSVGSFLLCALG